MTVDYLLEIHFDAAVEELVSAVLFQSSSSGSTVRGDVISAYFDSAEDREEAAEALRALPGVEVVAVERERVDWLERYEQSLEPIVIGRHFVVAPDASLFPDDERLRIVVPQEQAFGTGSHETTALCIEMLETLPVAGTRGLDVGAGSGILAIAMHRLGARKVVAFDNDLDAYAALRDNRMRNDVPESAMPIFIGGIESLRGGTFGIVTMNIIPEVIVPLLPFVVRRVRGSLILSGILHVRRNEVVAACAAQGLRFNDERSRGEWWAGVFAA